MSEDVKSLITILRRSAQASIPEGAFVLAYAIYSDKTHVENRRSRAVHLFNLFPLQGGIQLIRKPSSVPPWLRPCRPAAGTGHSRQFREEEHEG